MQGRDGRVRTSYLCRWERAATKSGILDGGGTSTNDGDRDLMKDVDGPDPREGEPWFVDVGNRV